MTQAPRTGSYPGASHDERWRSLVFPAGYVNPPAKRKYHLVVIGAGPAGLICALGAAGLGAKVALVERQAMGGDCLNVGCVPSKALLEYTRRRGPHASFDAAFAWMREVRADIAAQDSVERYSSLGVDVFLGEARFIDDATVQVHDRQLAGRRIVIATGARAAVPDIPGLSGSDPLTNESIFEIQRAPESLAIIGAGSVGCELAQALARMGIDIHLLDVATRVLPTQTPEASAAVMNALLREGVQPHLSARISSVEKRRNETRIAVEGSELHVKRVLVATGRNANVESLNLDVAGVDLTVNGLIKVDARLRTSNRKIYAAGDVCSRLQFTHHADAQARVVIQNTLFGPLARTDRLVIPDCTYTDPEVAQVGASAPMLEEHRIDFGRYRVKLAELDRGRVAGDTDDYAELLVAPRAGTILGATIVAEQAGELIVPVCVAMSNRLDLGDLGKTIFPYPTRSEYLRRIADDFNRTRLTPAVAKLLGAWLRLIA